jgi:hypothetical protein
MVLNYEISLVDPFFGLWGTGLYPLTPFHTRLSQNRLMIYFEL